MKKKKDKMDVENQVRKPPSQICKKVASYILSKKKKKDLGEDDFLLLKYIEKWDIPKKPVMNSKRFYEMIEKKKFGDSIDYIFSSMTEFSKGKIEHQFFEAKSNQLVINVLTLMIMNLQFCSERKNSLDTIRKDFPKDIFEEVQKNILSPPSTESIYKSIRSIIEQCFVDIYQDIKEKESKEEEEEKEKEETKEEPPLMTDEQFHLFSKFIRNRKKRKFHETFEEYEESIRKKRKLNPSSPETTTSPKESSFDDEKKDEDDMAEPYVKEGYPPPNNKAKESKTGSIIEKNNYYSLLKKNEEKEKDDQSSSSSSSSSLFKPFFKSKMKEQKSKRTSINNNYNKKRRRKSKKIRKDLFIV